LASTVVLDESLHGSPVRLSVDGVEVESCASEAESSSSGNLGVSSDSADFVPESEAKVVCSGTGK
jgi:hypothetical protein